VAPGTIRVTGDEIAAVVAALATLREREPAPAAPAPAPASRWRQAARIFTAYDEPAPDRFRRPECRPE
jgi:hypothetical protein